MCAETPIKKEERITSEKGAVFIKMGAFRNMITHVLRFASEALDVNSEVLGVCMGTYDKKSDKIVIENAIPISHGSNVEVGFSPEDYVAFAQIDEQYAAKGLYAVGWYHSHPGWGCFFSDTDIKNHLFYQKDQTPNSVGLVFDHTIMGKEGKLGFEVYRLDDHKRGPASDYHKVAFEVEIPNTLDYYKWVQKFVEDSQKKNPILIKELNEMTEVVPTDLQEIPKEEGAEEGEPAEEDPFPHVTPIISGFEGGVSVFQESFMNVLKTQLGMWSKDTTKGATKGMEFMKSTLSQMSEALSYGFAKVKNWFEENLDEITQEFKTDVSEYMDNRVEAQKALTSEILKAKDDISTEMDTVAEEGVKNISEKLDALPKQISEKLSAITETNSKLESTVNQNSEVISNLAGKITALTGNIAKGIEDTTGPFESDIVNKIAKLSDELKVIQETSSKLNETSKKLQNVIKELRNL